MSNPNELGDGAFGEYTPEDFARLDAQAAAQRESGVPAAEWLDHPDPFGMNWTWVEEEAAAENLAQPAEPETRPAPRRSYALYAGGAVLAASVLIAAGFLLAGQFGRGRDIELAAVVKARDIGVRGPGTVEELSVENRSRRKAFVAVVGVGARRTAVHYEEAGRFIEVEPGGTRVVKNLPAAFDGSAAHVVVLTATPAGESLARVATGGLPATPADARSRILAELEGLGYRGTTATVIDVSAANKN